MNAKKQGQFDRHRQQMLDRKVIDLLLEKAEVEEVKAQKPAAPQETPSVTQG